MTTPTDPLFAIQWHFGLIGNIQRIWDEYTGVGVHVGVYDDGIDLTHEDLAPNYDASRHAVDGSLNPIIPVHDINGRHGTSTAGLIGAANNGVGGVGVAYGVGLTAVNIFNPALYGYVNAADPAGFMDVVHQAASRFDISSNSWGASPIFVNSLADGGFADVLEDQYSYLSANGRGGLGTVIAQAAGNNNLDANGDGVNASRFTITVSATEQTGIVAYYSNFGASILVAAPAAAVTTDVTGAAGYDPGNYTTTFNGTSAATPVVSGVVALMLQANSGLGWRDVQNILAMSATLTGGAFNGGAVAQEDGIWQSNHSGIWNGGGNHIHTDYGYGMVNAYNAVRMAEVWNLFASAQTSANEFTAVAASSIVSDVIVTDNDPTGINATFNVVAGMSLDHVALDINLDMTYIGDLIITLTSAQGTTIVVKGLSGISTQVHGHVVWGLDQLRGELTDGTWTLHVADLAGGDVATIHSAQLNFYGSTAGINNTYHITDEYLAMLGFEAGRATIADSNAGTDWLDLAAVSGNVSIDMANGATFQVNAANWATLAGDFENIVTGDGNDTITGNALDNVIYGMRGDDVISGGENSSYGGAGDTMYGGAGNDTIGGDSNKDDAYGGAGNDTFVQAADFFADNVYGGDGTDTLDLSPHVFVNFVVDLSLNTYELDPNSSGANGVYDLFEVENVIGSQGNDSITGDGLNNQLSGSGGNDTISGGLGVDTLYGGEGNDLFRYVSGQGYDNIHGDTGVDSAVFEPFFGDSLTIDMALGTFNAGGPVYAFTDMENVTTANGNDSVQGNTQANVINLGDGNDTALGGGGFDTLIGGNGNDSLAGGDGIDSLSGDAGADTLNGGNGADVLKGGIGNDWYFIDNAADFIDEVVGGGTADRVLASVSFSLAADDDIEQMSTTLALGITSINLIGNDLAQSITGNAGSNSLNGNGGSDTIIGGAGNDTLTGGSGVDSLIGGADNDWYYVDNALDVVIEVAGGGTADRVLASTNYTLAATADIEQMSTSLASGVTAIVLTGNALAQTITGNAGANILNGLDGADSLVGLAGADTLNGGTGVDTMTGGADSDWYYVDNALDAVIEVVGGGTADRVLASVNYILSTAADIEQLSTTSAVGLTAINLTGNALAQTITGNAGINGLYGGDGADTLNGLAGADTLNGGTGIDLMIGGTENDWYFVDNAADVVVESVGGGTADRVLASNSYALAAGVDIEQLSTTSSVGLFAINLSGNAVSQTVTGNAGANILNGGLGNDTLVGNLGADQFMFNSALGTTNIDKIADYSVADDTIVLSGAIFTGIGANLDPAEYEVNGTGAATAAASRIIYDFVHGALYFDVDGVGGVAGKQFALITDHLVGLLASEFTMV